MVKELVVIGGGPAGLAAALSARENGIEDILIIERDVQLGGILNQCIHNGFGLHTFKEELTGPEYAQRYIDLIHENNIDYVLNTIVTHISEDKVITLMSAKDGLYHISAKSIILAMGCRERPRGALNIPGKRPAGIYSAGTAQRLVNIEGRMIGKKVVILGSGDIGLIMARRMVLEGADVQLVAEIMPFSGGLTRNIVQCLDDYGIPLKLSHTVVDIQGDKRVESVTIAMVDKSLQPIPGTEKTYECDTLLLSCGLIPENELSHQLGISMNQVTTGAFVNESLETNVEGIFACGNVLHVHDLVDYVSEESKQAGQSASLYLKGLQNKEGKDIRIVTTDGVRYSVPSTLNVSRMQERQIIRFRVGRVYRDAYVSVYVDDTRIKHLRKRILTPGEMEQVLLRSDELHPFENIDQITIKIEEV